MESRREELLLLLLLVQEVLGVDGVGGLEQLELLVSALVALGELQLGEVGGDVSLTGLQVLGVAADLGLLEGQAVVVVLVGALELLGHDGNVQIEDHGDDGYEIPRYAAEGSLLGGGCLGVQINS